MKSNIVLIGMPGVGKSTVGVILAKVLGYQFLDADLLIQEQEGKLLKDIIEEVGHGVTTIPAKGMFEGREKKLLICVIKPRQISKFQAVIEKYPDTFAYVGSVNEIIGKFNRGNK